MPSKISVSIIGATGYTGLELLRFLTLHPHVGLKHLVSHNHAGQKLSALFPHLQGVCDKALTDLPSEQVAKKSDLIFLALPHGESQALVPKWLGKTKIIDLAGDFRTHDARLFQKYYGKEHAFPQGLSQFVYGFSEGKKEEIKKANAVANPGCFAITAELALFPLKQWIKNVSVVAVTGSSGSGKIPKESAHHPIRSHNMQSYKIGTHQHLPEVMQTLGLQESQIVWVPTRGPFTRGIHLTAFVELAKPFKEREVLARFQKNYAGSPFVRLKAGVELAAVVGSNFGDIAIHQAGDKFIIQAVIDNLVKGAAGNAIQNMNLMMGFDETAGLLINPLYP
ncbi:N-acetyl-gamma-glutamyl-phosphate reductase [Candidatus Peregrinibacteria bacterium]|nr:N-acetyl-gamma-glutamyl-phosphate reductase [Candidatus Peregrinibacteria bacterium]